VNSKSFVKIILFLFREKITQSNPRQDNSVLSNNNFLSKLEHYATMKEETESVVKSAYFS
jgi:hypothetical protein